MKIESINGVNMRNTFSDKKIIENKIQCVYCGSTIESKTMGDLDYCDCGKLMINGGTKALLRVYNDMQTRTIRPAKENKDYKELSKFYLTETTL